jgi:hypothetical protein
MPRAPAVLARAARERAVSLVQRLAHLLPPHIMGSLPGHSNQRSLCASHKQTPDNQVNHSSQTLISRRNTALGSKEQTLDSHSSQTLNAHKQTNT